MDHVVIELDRDFNGGRMSPFLYHTVPVPNGGFIYREYSIQVPADDKLCNADITAGTDLSNVRILINCRITVETQYDIESKLLIGCVVVGKNSENSEMLPWFNDCIFLHTAVLTRVYYESSWIWNGCMITTIDFCCANPRIMGLELYNEDHETIVIDYKDITKIVPYTYVAGLFYKVRMMIPVSGKLIRAEFELSIYGDDFDSVGTIIKWIQEDHWEEEDSWKFAMKHGINVEENVYDD